VVEVVDDVLVAVTVVIDVVVVDPVSVVVE